jgi:hypothetical protein
VGIVCLEKAISLDPEHLKTKLDLIGAIPGLAYLQKNRGFVLVSHDKLMPRAMNLMEAVLEKHKTKETVAVLNRLLRHGWTKHFKEHKKRQAELMLEHLSYLGEWDAKMARRMALRLSGKEISKEETDTSGRGPEIQSRRQAASRLRARPGRTGLPDI